MKNCIGKIGKTEFDLPEEIGKLMRACFSLRSSLTEAQANAGIIRESLKETEAELREQLEEYFKDSKSVHVVFDGIDAEVQTNVPCKIRRNCITRLKQILGPRYDDLVNVSPKPSAALEAIALDQDDPLSRLVAPLLEWGDEKINVKYTPAGM